MGRAWGKGGIFGSGACFFGVRAPRTIGGPNSRGDRAPIPATPRLTALADLSAPPGMHPGGRAIGLWGLIFV